MAIFRSACCRWRRISTISMRRLSGRQAGLRHWRRLEAISDDFGRKRRVDAAARPAGGPPFGFDAAPPLAPEIAAAVDARGSDPGPGRGGLLVPDRRALRVD